MEHAALIQQLNNELAIDIPEKISYQELHSQLASYINRLIKNDFDKLVAFLYRIDVSEEKLKKLLLHNPQEDAGNIIATMIIERQVQKIKSREHFSKPGNDMGEEEKW